MNPVKVPANTAAMERAAIKGNRVERDDITVAFRYNRPKNRPGGPRAQIGSGEAQRSPNTRYLARDAKRRIKRCGR